MAETYQEISERRQELIRAWRGDSLGDVVEGVDADDLEWLLERIDAQIQGTRRPTSLETAFRIGKNPIEKDPVEKLRHQRIFVAGVLGNMRTLEKQTRERAAIYRANWSMGISGAAVLIALGALLVSLSSK